MFFRLVYIKKKLKKIEKYANTQKLLTKSSQQFFIFVKCLVVRFFFFFFRLLQTLNHFLFHSVYEERNHCQLHVKRALLVSEAHFSE